jgi:hypothetical protein
MTTTPATASPWAELIDSDSLPRLPEELAEPAAVLPAIVAACSEVALRHCLDHLDNPETAEVLAASVPDLTLEAAAVLLHTMAEAVEVEPLETPAALLEAVRDVDWPDVDSEEVADLDLDTLEAALDEAAEALAPGAIPALPDGAIDPRTIPAALSPRPATAWDVLSHGHSLELGWPLVTVNGEVYAVPDLEDLEMMRDVSAVDDEREEPGGPDTWAVLLELPPFDGPAQARAQRAALAKIAEANADLLGASA